jgi:SAM-dependent methyltransferase
MNVGLLVCPRCGGGLAESAGGLACGGCRASYAIREGVPELLPWSGGEPGPEWERWRVKLERLQDWRRDTWDGSAEAGVHQRVADAHTEEFFRFAAVPERSLVVEIGCGTGAASLHLPGRRYVGIDPLPLGIPAPLEGTPPPLILQGVGERLPLADARCDAVLLCETLDHALDPRRVLEEARRALKPGGILAVMQSVRVPVPVPPWHVRLRVAAGRLRARLRARLRGRRRTTDAETKMHVFTPEALRSLAGSILTVESSVTRGQTLYLRARKTAS